MAGASGLLMLRAVALWGRDLRVVIPLAVLHLGQWALYLRNGFIVKETWGFNNDGTQSCKFVSVDFTWIQAQYIYGAHTLATPFPHKVNDYFPSHGLRFHCHGFGVRCPLPGTWSIRVVSDPVLRIRRNGSHRRRT